MRSEFCMPALGADMEAGTVVQWNVGPGSRVQRGDVIAVVETDKGAIDVEIFEDGVVSELVVQPGTKVPVGTVLALLDTDRTASAAEATRVERPPAPAVTEAAAPAAVAAERVKISPAARRRAREIGIDPASLQGTGPAGAVTIADVEKSASAGTHVPAVAPAATARPAMREAIAEAMARSKREIPHYYLSLPADVTSATERLVRHNAAAPVSERLLFAALLIKAVGLACDGRSGFSGWFREGRFEAAPVAHVGVAVAIRGGGLVAPAIRDTATKPLPVLMAEFRDLVNRARAGRLRASEMAAPTIVLTSLGDTAVDAVFPIIQPPQVAIVGAGAVGPRPWVVAGQVAVRQVCTLSLGADHRVTDGRLGAQFLGDIAQLLAAPDSPVWRGIG